MIELNEKTQQDFLNREWVQRLLDAGVDMSDAKYYLCSLTIGKLAGGENVQIAWESELPYARDEEENIIKDDNGKECLKALQVNWCLPTYTVSELLYKLHEYIYPTINGVDFSGGLTMLKDAPFYIFYYNLHRTEKRQTVDGDEEVRAKGPEDYIYAEFEYPIESLAGILIQCHKKDIGIANKNINISSK